MFGPEGFRPFIDGETKNPATLSDGELAAEIVKVATLTYAGNGRPFEPQKGAALKRQHPQFKLQTDCGIAALAQEAIRESRGELLRYICERALLEHRRSFDKTEAQLAELIYRSCEQGQQIESFKRTFGDIFRGNLNEVMKDVLSHVTLSL